MTIILSFIFFLSGASALILEALWFHLSGINLGNSVWASSLVLSSFMAGLALGNGLVIFFEHKIKSPIRLYAFLEIVITVTGFALVLILPKLTFPFVPLFRTFSEHPLIAQSLRFLISFFLLLIPTTAMGVTLPILVKALYHKMTNFGRVLGILYGWNTMGAVFGVLTCEIFLLDWLGITGSGLVAACLNLSAAMTALWISRKKFGNSVSIESKDPFGIPDISLTMVRFLTASFFAGFTLLALEVIWFRFMMLFFNAYTLNFAIMLATILAGIGLGSLLVSKWFQLQSNAQKYLTPILLINGILIVLLYRYFGFVLNKFVIANNPLSVAFVSLFLMFPISFFSGIIFTMLGKGLHEELNAEAQATGLLTLANTIGGVFGSLGATLFIIPNLGIEKSFLLSVLIYGIVSLLFFDKNQSWRFARKIPSHYATLVIFLIILSLFPFGLMNRHFLSFATKEYIKNGEKRVAVKEGLIETIQYFQKDIINEPYYYRLVTNSNPMATTQLWFKRYAKLFVYLPVALIPNPKSAALICFGSGSTAKALTDTKSLENIEIVDISRDIVEMSDIVFNDPKENPIYDPRVNIHIEDGRFFLLTTKHKFDIVTAEPPPPCYHKIVNLYTQEYFQLIYDSLTEGGIVTYWLPVDQLSVKTTKSILKGFCNVFKNCSLWAGAEFEWVMMGIKNQQGQVDEKDFIRQWNDPVVGPEMRALGFESAEQFGSIFIADGRRLQNWISDSLPLTDNYPHRLSSYTVTGKKELPVYFKFMNHNLSRDSFYKSELISNIWPNSLRNKAEKYFAVRDTINFNLLLGTMEIPIVGNLHQCINNPLLKNYILWALDSDVFAQQIISNFMEKPEESTDAATMYKHLAAGAAQKRDYLMAEQYLRLALERLGFQKVNNLKYYLQRMYLLFLAGDIEKAEDVSYEYINLKENGKNERKKLMAGYWDLLVKILSK